MEGKALILLAERDPYAAEFTEYFLRTEGYDVSVVFSAEEALEAAEQRPPDLVIVELFISGAHGKRLCSQLLERSSAPVMAVCSLASATAAHTVGASAFLQKPLEPLELVAKIQELLEGSQPAHEAEE